MTMDTARYERLLDETLKRLEDAFDQVDPDDAEANRAGDTLTVAFRDGTKMIVTPQRPVQQLWVAAKNMGYHFRWDENASRWVEEAGRVDDFMALIATTAKEHGGIVLQIPPVIAKETQ